MEEKTLKELLLGKKPPKKNKVGGLQPDFSQLIIPVDDPECMGIGFCRGCGTILRLNEHGVKELSKGEIKKENLPLVGRYIEVDGCGFCGDEIENPIVKQK